MHQSILYAERDRIVSEIQANIPPVVLSIGDVTLLDYSTKRASKNIGNITSKKRKGFNVLSQLLCAGDGVALGLLSQHCWNYREEDLGKRRERQTLPIEAKETFHYLQQMEELHERFGEQTSTQFIHLFDRAGDVHELLQCRQYDHIHYIIRSKNDRKILDKDFTIRAYLDIISPCGKYEIDIKESKEKQNTFLEIKRQKNVTSENRTANIQVTFAKVTLKASNVSKNRPLKPVDVYVVRAKEVDPPNNEEAIDWVLLCSLPVTDFETAMQIIHYYSLRWQIENYHYILKQGAKIEQLQLQESGALVNAIGIYSIISVQVLRLRALAAKQPALGLEESGIDPQDYNILALYLNKKNKMEIQSDTDKVSISSFVKLLSVLGGNHNRKEPGMKSLWIGWRDFQLIKQAYHLFSSG